MYGPNPTYILRQVEPDDYKELLIQDSRRSWLRNWVCQHFGDSDNQREVLGYVAMRKYAYMGWALGSLPYCIVAWLR